MPKRTAKQIVELARTDLAAYCAALWPRFELSTHHRLIIETLEQIERGDTDRLMIFMPPRHGKSLLASQLFPSWYLGRHPNHSIIASSYGQELATDFGRRVRAFVSEPVHRAIFPQCLIQPNDAAAHRFGLVGDGAYFAVGASGPITGRGADLLLIDDPIKSREQAYSATERRNLQSWFEHVAYTRLEPKGKIVLIQTRWHEDDLAGWLLREHADEGWRVLSLAAIAEIDEKWRKQGAALWPKHFPLSTLERIREAIGGAAWNALYQQRPAAAEGAIFKREWWRSYEALPTDVRQVVFSVDSAFKTGEANDFTVIQCWLETATGYYLAHLDRERMEFPELKRKIVALATVWRPHAVLVEDAASGQSLIQTLRAESNLPILAVKPQGDKQARAHAVTALIESGKVYLPKEAGWLQDFVDELAQFPAAPHDDQVDAATQALNWLRERGGGISNILEYYRLKAEGGSLRPRVDPEVQRNYEKQAGLLFDRTPATPSPFARLRCGICAQPIGGNQTYCNLVGDLRGSYAHSVCQAREMYGG